jgi:oxaloacetate decarboxylase beta subunit
LGAAAQAGVFVTFFGAILLGFSPGAAAAIGIIGGADGPTAIYIAAKMAPAMLGTIAISAYSYMSLVPVIQPPIMRLLTTKEERRIRMPPPRPVSRRLRIIFPIIGFFISALIIPSSIPLMGMLFLGNLIRECGVTERLAKTIGTSFIDSITVILGFCVGLGTTYDKFLKADTIKVFLLGAFAFAVATAAGILFAKVLNLFSKNKINPLVGSAGVSAVPMAARVSQQVAAEEDPTNYLIFHAMAPNVAGVIGTAVAAGVFIAMLH